MQASPRFFEQLIKYEGLKLKAYKDSAGIWTIGIGTIKYPNGKPVKQGDVCTKDQAIEYARHDLYGFETVLNAQLPQVNQNQYDACLLLIYNIGAGAFSRSTVLRLIKANRTYPKIEAAWMQWNKARVNGVLQVIKGLTIRRAGEYKLYKTPAVETDRGK